MEICHQYPWSIKKSMVNTELILWVVGGICAQFMAIFNRNDDTPGLDPDICTVEERSPCWRISPAAANHSESLLLEGFKQEVERLKLETTKQCSFLFPIICDMEISGTHGSLNIPQATCLNGLRFWMSNSQFRPRGRGLKTLRLWDDPMNLTQWVFHDSSHQILVTNHKLDDPRN